MYTCASPAKCVLHTDQDPLVLRFTRRPHHGRNDSQGPRGLRPSGFRLQRQRSVLCPPTRGIHQPQLWAPRRCPPVLRPRSRVLHHPPPAKRWRGQSSGRPRGGAQPPARLLGSWPPTRPTAVRLGQLGSSSPGSSPASRASPALPAGRKACLGEDFCWCWQRADQRHHRRSRRPGHRSVAPHGPPVDRDRGLVSWGHGFCPRCPTGHGGHLPRTGVAARRPGTADRRSSASCAGRRPAPASGRSEEPVCARSRYRPRGAQPPRAPVGRQDGLREAGGHQHLPLALTKPH